MDTFCVRLAGLLIGVCAQFPSTKSFFRGYLEEGEALFTVRVTAEDLLYEREQALRQAELDGVTRRLSDPYLETLSVLRLIAAQLLSYDTLLFHGAAVAVDGRAYLFTAPSGTGKTTHVRLWLSQIPGAYVLNGDKPFLRVTEGGVEVCGNPWQGKENYGCNEILPLAAICLLERGAENRIEPIGLEKALGTLLKQTNIPSDDGALLEVLRLMGRLSSRVRLYRLSCNMEPEAALVSAGAMLERGEP